MMKLNARRETNCRSSFKELEERRVSREGDRRVHGRGAAGWAVSEFGACWSFKGPCVVYAP